MITERLDQTPISNGHHVGGTVVDQTVRLRSGLHVLPHGYDEVFVRAGSRASFSKVIKDPKRRQLLSRLVQHTTEPVAVTELAARLDAPEADVVDLLGQLVEAEVVAPVGAELGAVAVRLIGDGAVARTLASNLAGLAREVQLTAQTSDEWRAADIAELDADLVVVATDHLHPALNLEINAAAHDARVPVLFSHVDGTELVVGPVVLPGESACYLCFDMQDEGARHLRDEYLMYKDALDRQRPDRGAESATAILAAAWIALVVARFDPDQADFLVSRVLRVETTRMEVMAHKILQIPRCPACSAARPDLEHTFL